MTPAKAKPVLAWAVITRDGAIKIRTADATRYEIERWHAYNPWDEDRIARVTITEISQEATDEG